MPAISPNLYDPKLVNSLNKIILPATPALESAGLDLQGASLLGLILPDVYSSGSLTFRMSPDGNTLNYKNVKKIDGSGEDYSVLAAANDYIPLDPSVFAGCQWIKLVCSAAQSAQREVLLVMGPLWQ